jgi:hypothetical protein
MKVCTSSRAFYCTRLFFMFLIKLYHWLPECQSSQTLTKSALDFAGPRQGCHRYYAPPSREFGSDLCRRLYDEDMEALIFLNLFSVRTLRECSV